MTPKKSRLQPSHRLAIGLALISILFCIPGCPQPNPPAVNAQLLPGVWRARDEGFDIVWTFAPGGALRWQLQPTTGWQALVVGGFDVTGRWSLVGDQLTMELSETPLALALFGHNWNGQRSTGRIKTLTGSTLELDDSDLKFQRSLAPANSK